MSDSAADSNQFKSGSTNLAAPHGGRAYGPLRLWPGVVLLAVLWIVRVLAGIGPGSPMQFFVGLIIAPLVIALGVNLWWLFASRLSWRDGFLVVGVFLAAAAATYLVAGKNFPGMALIMYALPIILSVWIGWLIVSMRLAWPARLKGLVALLILSWASFTVIRVDGMDGSFKATFNWRWTPTAEDKLLSELGTSGKKSALEGAAAAEKMELAPGDWSGFRGPARDGRLAGVRIGTDWKTTPPREVWRHRIGPGWSSFAVVGDRIYTQEQRGDDELVVCYDLATGNELWVHRDTTRFTEVVAGPGPRATPTFHEGYLYALGANGKLNCLDAASGKLKWTRDIVADSGAKVPQWGFSSSPLVEQGVVSVFAGGPEGKSVLGYKVDDGELAWTAGEGALSYCSTHPARLSGVDQLLIITEVGLTALDPASGHVLWLHSWPVEGIARVVQPTLLSDTDLLIGTGMGVGTRRISVSHESENWPTKELWTSKSIKPYYNDLVVHGDNLYGFDGNIFMCVGLDDGKIRWRHRGYGNGQVLLLTDQALLLVLTEQGEVALVEATPEAHKEIASFKAIDGKTWNHPVIAHNKLLVRNGEEAACFELPPPAEAP